MWIWQITMQLRLSFGPNVTKQHWWFEQFWRFVGIWVKIWRHENYMAGNNEELIILHMWGVMQQEGYWKRRHSTKMNSPLWAAMRHRVNQQLKTAKYYRNLPLMGLQLQTKCNIENYKTWPPQFTHILTPVKLTNAYTTGLATDFFFLLFSFFVFCFRNEHNSSEALFWSP